MAVYGRMLGHDFVIWDDPLHITRNPMLNPVTPQSLAQLWQRPYFSLYMPLTYTLWAVETVATRAWQGVGPTGPLSATLFKFVSLAMHVGNVLLVFMICRLLVRSDRAALAGALLFALHPAQVEAVAWISDNKGLLCTLLTLSALWLHLKDDGAPSGDVARLEPGKGEGSGVSASHHFTATVLYALALLAKPTAVVLPLIAWSLDVVGRRRGLWPTTRRLADWVLIAVVWIVVTRWSQSSQQMSYITPLPWRPVVAADSLAFYFEKLVWPVKLCPDYGRTPQKVLAGPLPDWRWLLPLAVLGLVMARPRGLGSAAVLVFVVALSPVLGLLPFHFQEISTVADRYLYLPMLGASLAVAVAVDHRTVGRVIGPAMLLVLPWLGYRSWQQVDVWRNSHRLLSAILACNPTSYAAHNNLAVLLRQEKRLDDAKTHFRRAAELKPQVAEPHIGLGTIYLEEGRPQLAEAELREALRLDPRLAFTHQRLAMALEQQGKYKEAIAHLEKSLKLEPRQPQVARRLAWILATHPDPAIRDAQRAVRLAETAIAQLRQPGYRMLDTLAAAYASAGQYERAVAAITQAIELARARGNQQVVAELEKRLDRYRHGRPLGKPSQGKTPSPDAPPLDATSSPTPSPEKQAP